MAEKTLSSLLTRFITVYLFLPILGLSLIMISYAGWQRLEGLRLQKRTTVKNAARAIESELTTLSKDLQRSGLLLRAKEHWPQLDLLNYLNFRTAFDRLLLLSRQGEIQYALNDLNRQLPELSGIYDQQQLEYLSQIQISKPYKLQGSDELRLALLTSTPAGELLLGEISMTRLHSRLARFVSSDEEFVFLAAADGDILTPTVGPNSSKARQLVSLLPESTPIQASSSFIFSQNTVLSTSQILLPNWRIGLSTPMNKLLLSFVQYLGLLLVAVLLTILTVAHLLFKRLDREVVRPVGNLRQSVAKLKQGEYPVLSKSDPAESSFQEFDDLEFEFKSMIQILALREASLRQKTSEQQLLLDNVPLQIWFMTDPETQGAVNEARARFFGRPAEETGYRSLNEVLEADTAAVEIRSNETVFKQKQTLRYETWSWNADGQERLLAIRKIPKLNESGQVEYVVCTAQDRTDSWQYEQKLRELSTAVQQSPASIIITDSTGRIQYVNPSFCQLSGYAEHEVLGLSPAFLTSGDKPREEYAKLWQTISSGNTWSGEFHNKKKSGQLYWVSALISPIFDQDGRITHYMAFQEDITAKKETEHELLRAKLEAESANETKSQFLANISHEIRTPINGIIGMCSLLTDSSLSEEQQVFAETISSSASSLLDIINQILDFSKIESGSLELENILFDLHLTIQRSLDMFTSQALEKGLKLDSGIHESVPQTLIGDPIRLQQVLMNLLGNAVKFTESGSVFLLVTPQLVEESELLLKFEISDTGPGIPQQKKETIFEPFIQGDGSTTRKYGGTGLGLSICRQIVEIMGGQMGLDSQEHQGSKFWFTVRFQSFCPVRQSSAGSGGRASSMAGQTSLHEQSAGYQAASSETSHSIFDPTPLRENLGCDGQTIKEILGLFMEDVRDRLVAIDHGLDCEDCKKVADNAFELKGSSANIGAVDLADRARRIEEACCDGDLDKAGQLVETFKARFQTFQMAVQGTEAALPVEEPAKGRA